MRTRMLALAVLLAFTAPAIVAAAPAASAKLAQSRVDAAAQAYADALAHLKVGQATVDLVATWSVRWLTALREQPVRGTALKQALADHVKRMTDLEAATAKAVDAGIATSLDIETADYFRIEAELWAARGK